MDNIYTPVDEKAGVSVTSPNHLDMKAMKVVHCTHVRICARKALCLPNFKSDRARADGRHSKWERYLGSIDLEHLSSVMCVGFSSRPGKQIVFESETPIRIRFQERAWRYRYQGEEGNLHIANRWRLEIVADRRQSRVQPGHTVVIAQTPYSSNWIQTARFKTYLKKRKARLPEAVVPRLKEDEDPVDFLERTLNYDPWENGDSYVAGVSLPNGFQEQPRYRANRATLIFGACPDFENLVKDIFSSQAVHKMLRETKENKIKFWYRAGLRPRLYSEVIEEAPTLMGLSIQQALAGPTDSPTHWIGQPISNLIRQIYSGHLNARNRTVHRRFIYESPFLVLD